MPELIQTFKAMQKTEEEKRKFLASLQGIKWEDEVQEGPTFEDVQRKAMGIDADQNDIVSLQGDFASQAGFGIGMGIGYSKG